MYQLYPIYNQKQHYRMKNNWIVLVQIRDFFKNGSFVPPHSKRESMHYTWGIWQQYFYGELQQKELPMHYFSELLDQDYVIYQGLNKTQRSGFITDLVQARVIPHQYLDAIVVALGADYSIDKWSDRMSDHLCDKLLSGLMREHQIDFTHIVKLDDILLPGWEPYAKEAELAYDIAPMDLFNIDLLYFNLKRYIKR